MATARRRKQKSDYALQLMEKQKAKYTYGVLERQFRNLFDKASSKGGVTGEVLLAVAGSTFGQYVVFRLGNGTYSPRLPVSWLRTNTLP
jgi:small subunit ribosomal protein S4